MSGELIALRLANSRHQGISCVWGVRERGNESEARPDRIDVLQLLPKFLLRHEAKVRNELQRAGLSQLKIELRGASVKALNGTHLVCGGYWYEGVVYWSIRHPPARLGLVHRPNSRREVKFQLFVTPRLVICDVEEDPGCSPVNVLTEGHRVVGGTGKDWNAPREHQLAQPPSGGCIPREGHTKLAVRHRRKHFLKGGMLTPEFSVRALDVDISLIGQRMLAEKQAHGLTGVRGLLQVTLRSRINQSGAVAEQHPGG